LNALILLKKKSEKKVKKLNSPKSKEIIERKKTQGVQKVFYGKCQVINFRRSTKIIENEFPLYYGLRSEDLLDSEITFIQEKDDQQKKQEE